MLPAQRVWRESVSSLDIMWPQSNQWDRALLRRNLQLYNNLVYHDDRKQSWPDLFSEEWSVCWVSLPGILISLEIWGTIPRAYSIRCPIGTYTGRLRPKGVSFSGFRFMRRRDFISWSIYKGREICHLGLWKDPKGVTDEFYGFMKSRKRKGYLLWKIIY